MQQITGTSIYRLDGLAKVARMKLDVELDLSTLTPATRRAVLKYLRTGFISAADSSKSGRIAFALLRQSGVFFMACKRSGYTHLTWYGALPPGMDDPVERLREADETATKVAGHGYHVNDHWRELGWLHFHTLLPHQHVPEYLEPIVSSPGYQAAIAPYIRAVENGERVKVDVRRGPRWI